MPTIELFRLDGKVAIVTGVSSGLGVAFAQGLAEAGADVAQGALPAGLPRRAAASRACGAQGRPARAGGDDRLRSPRMPPGT